MNDHHPTVDINRANVEELTSIPGIGPALAERIIAARPFDSIDDLKRVSGIGLTSFNQWRDKLVAHPVSSQSPAPDVELPEALTSDLESPDENIPASVSGDYDQAAAEDSTVEFDEATVEAEPSTILAATQVDRIAETEVSEALKQPGAEDIAASPELSEAVKPAPEAGTASDTKPKGETTPAGKVKPGTKPGKSPRYISRSGFIWTVVLGSLLTLIVAVAITLGILIAANGDLRYVNPNQFAILNRQVEGLNAQANTLQQDLDGLRGRVENLEGLSGRVSGVEENLTTLQTEFENIADRMNDLNDEISTLTGELEDLKADSTRFQSFLEGMRSLLEETLTPQGETDVQ